MAQSKRTRKSDRHHLREHAHHIAKTRSEEHPLDAQTGGVKPEAISCSLPTPSANHQGETSSQSDREPMPLALIPQHLPVACPEPQRIAAETAPRTKRKLPTAAKAVLLSACLTAVVIFSVGTFKSNQNAVQVTQADAPLVTSIPTSVAHGGQPEKNASPLGAAAAAKRTRPVASKPSVLASKSGLATTNTDKKLSRARAEHSTHPVADNAKKKTAPTVAKTPNKPLEDHSATLLAQNSVLDSKSNLAQDRYAQCQELSNFLRREQCKWQACNGKWGQDGCPSYANSNREFN